MLRQKGIGMEALLRTQRLSKGNILRDISFSLHPGEIAAVMGPSGSGKSTLLYNIAGMDAPDEGEVWLGDVLVTDLSEDEKADLRLRRMGFIFQQMNMVNSLDILDNILLPALEVCRQERTKNKSAMEKRARSLMRALHIDGLEHRQIGEVSGGQLQRACICRSLMNEPQILLADEPTGALNRSASEEVMQTLTQLNKIGTTILMVTHDAKVATCCSRILYLLDGSICGQMDLGDPTEHPETDRVQKLTDWLSSMGW